MRNAPDIAGAMTDRPCAMTSRMPSLRWKPPVAGPAVVESLGLIGASVAIGHGLPGGALAGRRAVRTAAGTSRAGLRSKKPNGLRAKPV